MQGLDEIIGQGLAAEYGLKIKQAVFNLPDELLLFLLIIFSVIAGFIIGYNWRRLFAKGR